MGKKKKNQSHLILIWICISIINSEGKTLFKDVLVVFFPVKCLPTCTFYPLLWGCYCCSVAKSCLTLTPVDWMKHVRFACPSPSPRVCPSSCPLNQWCHPTISSSVALFSCLQIFPSIRTFSSESALCISGQRTGTSASASILSTSIQG